GDKAWTPSSCTLLSEFFEDVDNDILEENAEENAINDVCISTQVGRDSAIKLKNYITQLTI
ncbi:hypothetical protein Gohar_017556, partial [Gossypium harknessii]|nr:hypothetical protein [Gossypium harknessii]